MRAKKNAPRKSELTRGETIAVFIYIPIHFVLLPWLLGRALERGMLNEAAANFAIYAVGAVYMLLFTGRFLRRDFDVLCEHPFATVLCTFGDFGLIFVGNAIVGLVIGLFGFNDNPNNAAVEELASSATGVMTAATVYLAPIVEELIFRAGIFGTLRRKSVKAAYIVSVLIFSLYHVWSYALMDVRALVYMLQYIPATLVLCANYDASDSIWCPIFLHMLVNGISMLVLA